ncbi:MAG: hypothetical protein ACE5JS_12890 [Nitrospinota bacterium]
MKRALSLVAVASILLLFSAQARAQKEVRVAFFSPFILTGGGGTIKSIVLLRNLSSDKPLTILNVEIIDQATGLDVANLGSGCPFAGELPFVLEPLGQGQNAIKFFVSECLSVGPKSGPLVGSTLDSTIRADFLTILTVEAAGDKAIGGNTALIAPPDGARRRPYRRSYSNDADGLRRGNSSRSKIFKLTHYPQSPLLVFTH